MRVLVHAPGNDTGGQGYRIEEAFANQPDWHVEAHNASRSSLGYPEHHALPIGERMAEVRRQYAAADVVHLRNVLTLWQQLDRGRHVPVVLHHHGTQFRDSHGRIGQHARQMGAVQVASTLDLTLLEPDVQWLPAPYDVEALHAMRAPIEDGLVRVAHFPTSKRVKSTDAFMAAMRGLSSVRLLTNALAWRGPTVRTPHIPWPQVMAQKATADILYDQVLLGYGNNAIEAMAMGVPVIAGAADPRVRALMLERFGELPFAEATVDTLPDVLRRMVESASMRQEYAERGLAHVRRWHDYPVVVEQLKALWSSTPPSRAWPTVTSSPGWLARQAQLRGRAA